MALSVSHSIYGHPPQGKNVTEEEYDALGQSLNELKVLLPQCEEYKGELPQPKILQPQQQQQQQQAQDVRAKRGREDTDSVTADDWAKMDTMVFNTHKEGPKHNSVFKLPLHSC